MIDVVKPGLITRFRKTIIDSPKSINQRCYCIDSPSVKVVDDPLFVVESVETLTLAEKLEELPTAPLPVVEAETLSELLPSGLV